MKLNLENLPTDFATKEDIAKLVTELKVVLAQLAGAINEIESRLEDTIDTLFSKTKTGEMD